MMGKWWLIAKTLVRSSLDHYILPGTLTGTEILLVYLYQWKRNFSILAAALVYLLCNQPDQNELDDVLVPAQERTGFDAGDDSV